MTYIKQIAQQIIKDRVVINNEGNPELGAEIIKAFNELKFPFIGFEIDRDYYEAQEKRFKDFVSQLRMF